MSSFAHSFQFIPQFYVLEVIDSTNNYALDKIELKKANHGDAFFAKEQTRGRGQLNKQWLVQANKNIILTVIFDTTTLPVSIQFNFNAMVAYTVINFLTDFYPSSWAIKWPNDIYYNDRKAAGILVENKLRGNKWLWAVVGIGININQTEFEGNLQNKAISLSQITQQEYDPIALAQQLAHELRNNFEVLKEGRDFIIDYNTFLYKKNKWISVISGGQESKILVKCVDNKGALVVQPYGVNELLHLSTGAIQWL